MRYPGYHKLLLPLLGFPSFHGSAAMSAEQFDDSRSSHHPNETIDCHRPAFTETWSSACRGREGSA
jgi:hypothetical protein